MISGLIDKLRSHADLYDGKTEPPINHELQRPYLAQELRDAADTIWQLRDDLQRANAENAKLRELCAGLLTGYECGYGELCKGCEWDGLGDSKTFSCLPRAEARELGVEVTS